MSHLLVDVPPPIRKMEGRPWFIVPRWQVVVVLLLMAWLYASILGRLFLQWVGPNSDPNFQHGVFVPLFALFVLWQDRQKLKAIPSAPSWAGLPLVVMGLVVLILGVLGAENFLSRVSLLILLAGLVIVFQGWTFFRAVLFPWAFLILMIPIPKLIIQHVTFPLQLLAAKLATALLQQVGVPVLREGNLIYLAAIPLDVADACSGIRSLLTLVTLAIIYGYLMETRVWVRVVLAVLAVPIAVTANSFRIFGTGLLVQYWDKDKAEGFYHALGGWLIFVVALICLFAVHRVIALIWKSGPDAGRAVTHSCGADTLVRVHAVESLAARTRVSTPPRDQARPASEMRMKAGSVRFGVGVVLMLATALVLQARSRGEYIPTPPPPSSLPLQIDSWTGTDIPLDQETREILGPGNFVVRDYENAIQPQPSINLYIAYFPTQRAGDTIHSPQQCLPGAGWVPTARDRVQIIGPDSSRFAVNRYVVAKSGDRLLVLYWFQAHGRAVASEYSAKYYLIDDSIRLNRSDGALVRMMTPMFDGESADAAQARMMKLGSQVLPLLDTYIPR
jgi:exosortase D (VPLPA-CTERM-specific)